MFPVKKKLNDHEKINWLRLIRTENIGPMTFYQLLRQCGSIDQVFERLPQMARNGGRLDGLKIPSITEIESEIEKLHKIGGEFIFACEPNYPYNLGFVEDAPPVLSTIGNLNLLTKTSLAVVGSRNSSMNGEKFAFNISQEIGRSGYVIISGLARGIDRYAHLGSIETGTIGVLAGGINVIYPPENEKLYHEMKEKGLILAENPFGMEPIARHFPKRNRIVSGIAKGVLVVEAALRSGSLITARFALEQGRDVFAVPGSPFDPRCKGTNGLLREGAILVEKAEDITNILSQSKQSSFLDESEHSYDAGPPISPDENDVKMGREILLNKLGTTPIEIDSLLDHCDLTPNIGLSAILELELAGKIEREAGGKIYKIDHTY